jgi:hypothetical protein
MSISTLISHNEVILLRLCIHLQERVHLNYVCFYVQTGDLEDACDQTWIVSGQSAEQQKLIELHPSDQPIYVEGAFRVWISRVCINYFILRAEPKPVVKKETDPDGRCAYHQSSHFVQNEIKSTQPCSL